MISFLTLLASLLLLVILIFAPSRGFFLIHLALALLASLLVLHSLVSFQILQPFPDSLFGINMPLSIPSWAPWFQGLILSAGIVVLLMIRQEEILKSAASSHKEWIFLLAASLGGMLLLPVSADLITLWIALELSTIPAFLMTAWDKSRKDSGEAGIKFLLNSALASAFFLLGSAFLYGKTGSLDLGIIFQSVAQNPEMNWMTALILVAIGFKIGLVPFHLWIADIYTTAPWPIIAFLSLASKGVGLAFLLKLFPLLSGLTPTFFALLAAVTMTVGNLAAVVQKNMRRLLAFSSISQMGYFLMAFLSPQAQPALIYYFMVYLVSDAVVLLGIAPFCQTSRQDDLKTLNGLSQTRPLLALAIMIGLFSLAGIPPLSGFVGKFFLFNLAAQEGFYWLVALAAVNSTVSLYYYLQLVRPMAMNPPSTRESPPLDLLYRTGILLTTLASASFGLIPIYDWLIR